MTSRCRRSLLVPRAARRRPTARRRLRLQRAGHLHWTVLKHNQADERLVRSKSTRAPRAARGDPGKPVIGRTFRGVRTPTWLPFGVTQDMTLVTPCRYRAGLSSRSLPSGADGRPAATAPITVRTLRLVDQPASHPASALGSSSSCRRISPATSPVACSARLSVYRRGESPRRVRRLWVPRKLRGGSMRYLQGQRPNGFPFLPGCSC